jgi:hypothetical protein
MILKSCCCHVGKKSQMYNKLSKNLSSDFKSVLFKFLSHFSLLFIGLYRSVFTAHFGAGVCRFEPTCSAYANQAFLKYPFLTAFKLVLKRVLKCYPGSSFGYDPLPNLVTQPKFSSEIAHECR